MTTPDLLTRLEKARGPDRELDALFHAEIKGWRFIRTGAYRGLYFVFEDRSGRFTEDVPRYTESAESIAALRAGIAEKADAPSD